MDLGDTPASSGFAADIASRCSKLRGPIVHDLAWAHALGTNPERPPWSRPCRALLELQQARTQPKARPKSGTDAVRKRADTRASLLFTWVVSGQHRAGCRKHARPVRCEGEFAPQSKGSTLKSLWNCFFVHGVGRKLVPPVWRAGTEPLPQAPRGLISGFPAGRTSG